ncbi:hypothetical protein ABKP09_13600 [Peribacillus frigoritolerans]
MVMTKEELLSHLKRQARTLEFLISTDNNEESKRIHSETLEAIRGVIK